jgi:hypothetical protein
MVKVTFVNITPLMILVHLFHIRAVNLPLLFARRYGVVESVLYLYFEVWMAFNN